MFKAVLKMYMYGAAMAVGSVGMIRVFRCLRDPYKREQLKTGVNQITDALL